MRFVCPKDVKKMLVQRARSVYEEVGSQARVRRVERRNMAGTRASSLEHRNVARKMFLEGEWTQKRLFDVGRSDVSQCQACQIEEGTEKHRVYHCPEWYEVRREIPEAFRRLEQNARTSKNEWKWPRGIVVHPLSESQWNRGHFGMRKWESEKHKSWCMAAEGFHVATDGSLLGAAGKWRACGWQWCSWIMMRRGRCTADV